MAFRPLKKRCDECGRILLFRRAKEKLLVRVLQHLPCHHCHPERLDECCGGCRYPFSIVGHHSNGLCGSCAVSEHRWKHRELTAA